MFRPDPVQPSNKAVRFSVTQERIYKQSWPKVIGLLVMSVLVWLPLLFLWVAPAHALPGSFNTDRRTENSAYFGIESDRAQDRGGPDFSIPAQQVATTTLTVDIISSPWATVDHNGVPGVGGRLPAVFVVEAVITNTGSAPAVDVEVNLDYNPGNGWTLLPGEDPVRTVDELAPGAAYHAYWFAGYPQVLPPNSNASHQYTVTADAANASPVATSENFYNPDPSWTVRTRSTQNTGNSGLIQSSANIVVGVAFTVTVEFTLGTNPADAVFSPVGNDDFDPGSYRLLASQVRFLNNAETQQSIVNDRLYFPNVPNFADKAEVTYTFIATWPSNTTLCPYAAFDYSPAKYDENFCASSLGTQIPVTGTLTLSQTKQVSNLIRQQNQLVTYTVSYTNTGDQPLQYVWIWDDIPTTVVSIVTSSVDPASDPDETNEGRVAWNLDTIAAAGQVGSTGTLTFAVLIDGGGQDLADGTSLVNHAFLGISPSGLPQRAVITSTVTTTIRAPMIAFSKTDGQEIAGPGDLLTYTLRITNSGSVAASGLVITDVLPADVTLAGATTPGFNLQDGQTLVWNNLGLVPPTNGTLLVSIPVRVNADVAEGTILSNAGTVSYRNAAGHTFAAKTANDTTVAHVPVLTIAKTAEDADGPPLMVGDTISYTLQVANTGNYTASDVTVTDDLPGQVTCQAVSGDNAPACADPLIWSIPNLAPGNAASLYVVVTVNPGSEGQTITNTASVTSSNVFDPPDDPPSVCPDGNQPVGGVCATTPAPLDTTLAFDKTAEDLSGPPLAVNDTIRYTLQVTNTGNYTAYNVIVTDDLPDGVTYVNASADRGTPAGSDPVIWTIPGLPPDTVASLWIMATINPDQAGQVITNTGSVTGSNVSDPPEDPTPVCPDGTPEPCDPGHTPVPSTTLAFDKTAEDIDGPPLEVSDTVRYTLLVTNTGSYTAFNVVVTDTLPAGVTFIDTTPSHGFTSGSDPIVWYVGDIPPSGAVATLIITVTLNADTAGQSIVNTGVVTSGNVDDLPPNPQVCPDGSPPVNGICEIKPAGAGSIFLPIIMKNMR